jgi:predicted nicotinamide N-methyase
MSDVTHPNALDLAYRPVPFVPEVSLFQAAPDVGLFDSCGGEYHSEQPPPFWAFPWPGGQALARFVLDNPDVVAGRRVLDLGTGSGLVSIAAAFAGASAVYAVDRDAAALDAVRRNVAEFAACPLDVVEPVHADVLDVTVAVNGSARAAVQLADVVLAGDLFYAAPIADSAMRFLRRVERRGARVLVGDAARGFLPGRSFTALAHYSLPTRGAAREVPSSTGPEQPALEGTERTDATVWELRRSRATPTTRPDGS